MQSSDRNRDTNTFLIKVGELLYGRHRWQHQFYLDLGISRRTLANYKSGAHPVPMKVVHKAIDLLRTRQVDITAALPSSISDKIIKDHISEINQPVGESSDNLCCYYPNILRMNKYLLPAAPTAPVKLDTLDPQQITKLIEKSRHKSNHLPLADWANSLIRIPELQRYVISDDLDAHVLIFVYIIDGKGVIFLALCKENSHVPLLTFDLRCLDWRRGNWRYLRDFAWFSEVN